MRRAARTDRNQGPIVDALRDIPGVTVEVLSAVGGGCPDLAIGYRGMTFLVELKDGGKPPSKRVLTPEQEKWHADWKGHRAVAKNLGEVLDAIGVKRCA